MTETRNKWCGIKIKSDKKVSAMEISAVFGYIFVLDKNIVVGDKNKKGQSGNPENTHIFLFGPIKK